ncbi:MAG TPA: hypothetical protein VN678_00510 [Acidobacteriaceae bacterium]|nr:hypothetical protein [Acidobacteriaceae bacterium]
MDVQFWWTIHTLPLWFLVFSLFLPRLALLVYWLDGQALPFHIHGWLPLVVAILAPRLLVIYLIYMDQGVSFWFVVHLIAALIVFASGGRYQTRKRLERQRAIG